MPIGERPSVLWFVSADLDPEFRASLELSQLQRFYSEFDNSDSVLSDWTGEDYCSWTGVKCNSDGTVIEL